MGQVALESLFNLEKKTSGLVRPKRTDKDLLVTSIPFRNKDGFVNGAIELLQQYNWPGNVRELENIIERLMVVAQSDNISEDVVCTAVNICKVGGIQSILHDNEATLKDSVMVLEKHLIEKALNDTGSSYKAAEKLGINQSTIVRKAQKLGINGWRE